MINAVNRKAFRSSQSLKRKLHATENLPEVKKKPPRFYEGPKDQHRVYRASYTREEVALALDMLFAGKLTFCE